MSTGWIPSIDDRSISIRSKPSIQSGLRRRNLKLCLITSTARFCKKSDTRLCSTQSVNPNVTASKKDKHTVHCFIVVTPYRGISKFTSIHLSTIGFPARAHTDPDSVLGVTDNMLCSQAWLTAQVNNSPVRTQKRGASLKRYAPPLRSPRLTQRR
jgi:hypothetical protein